MTEAVIYDPPAGEHITHACEKAVELAIRHGRRVEFTFNGVPLVAHPTSGARELARRWQAESDRRAEEWRQSPEGQRVAREAEAARRAAQAATEALIQELPHRLGTLDSAVRWCADFARVADHVGLDWSPEIVADELLAAGYAQNAHVGRPPEDFEADRRLMGEYIIGQAIDCLRKGMPPHPMVITFAERGGFLN